MDRIEGVSSEELMACLIWLYRFLSLVPPRNIHVPSRPTIKKTSIEDILGSAVGFNLTRRCSIRDRRAHNKEG